MLYGKIQDAIMRRVIKEKQLSYQNPVLFEAVFFEVVNRCNSSCMFCNASVKHDTRQRKEMSFELYDKIIRQLAEMNYAGRIAYHVANDPLVFADVERFVGHARKLLPKAWIQIMTNGIALNPQRGEALIENGMDELFVNFYKTSADQPMYPGLSKFITEVLNKRFPHKKGIVYSSADKRSKLTFQLMDRRTDEVLWSRGGTSPNKDVDNSRVRGCCVFPWTQLNISTDGLVSKCCADIYFEDVMGDLSTQSIMDVWNGEAYRKVRKSLLAGERRGLLCCKECDYFGVANSDMSNFFLKMIKYHFFAKY